MEQSRRNFIQKTALGIAGAVSMPIISKATSSNIFPGAIRN